MKSIITRIIVVFFISSSLLSCNSEEISSNHLDQSEKFSEFGKFFLNLGEINQNQRNALGFNPFLDPATLTGEEIRINAENCLRIYVEIKNDYILNGGREYDFNQYFTDNLTDEILDEVYPVHETNIQETMDAKDCWRQYGINLSITSMDYTVSLGSCMRWYGADPVCAVQAYAEFSANAYDNYRTFYRCIEKLK